MSEIVREIFPIQPDTLRGKFDAIAGQANNIMSQVTPQTFNANTDFGKDIEYLHLQDPDPTFSRNALGHRREYSLNKRAGEVGLILVNRVEAARENDDVIEAFPGSGIGKTIKVGLWLGSRNIYSIGLPNPDISEVAVTGPKGKDLLLSGRERSNGLPLYTREMLDRRLGVITAGLDLLTNLTDGGVGKNAATDRDYVKDLSTRAKQASKHPSLGALISGLFPQP